MRRFTFKYKLPIVIGAFILYIWISRNDKRHYYEQDGIIPYRKPADVWNYVADFSKMKNLNPTILNFKILSESGNMNIWKYTVEYTEQLSHWPYWLNTAIGDYIVTKGKSFGNNSPELYSIQSQHRTCFFHGLYCLYTDSVFEFSSRGSNTYMIEKIYYQCPALLGIFCEREVAYQRHQIMENLIKIFKNMDIKTKH